MLEKEETKLKDEDRTRCEVWTRVMGYHRPISSFNIGKRGEVAERKYFSVEKAKHQVREKNREKIYCINTGQGPQRYSIHAGATKIQSESRQSSRIFLCHSSGF